MPNPCLLLRQDGLPFGKKNVLLAQEQNSDGFKSPVSDSCFPMSYKICWQRQLL